MDPKEEDWTNRPEINTPEELLPVVDDEGCVTGCVTRRQAHLLPGELHPVVHLHVINAKGELFLQKRSKTKDIFPLRWDTSVGGHIAWQETPELALEREAFEEIGMKGFKAEFIGTTRTDTEFESEYVYIFMTRYDGPFALNPDELEDGRFWRPEDIEKLLGRDFFTPNFEQDYPLLQSYLRQRR